VPLNRQQQSLFAVVDYKAGPPIEMAAAHRHLIALRNGNPTERTWKGAKV
jgi:hypothetical protein